MSAKPRKLRRVTSSCINSYVAEDIWIFYVHQIPILLSCHPRNETKQIRNSLILISLHLSLIEYRGMIFLLVMSFINIFIRGSPLPPHIHPSDDELHSHIPADERKRFHAYYGAVTQSVVIRNNLLCVMFLLWFDWLTKWKYQLMIRNELFRMSHEKVFLSVPKCRALNWMFFWSMGFLHLLRLE